MKASLTNLIELQRIDKELQALEALKGDLPQQVQKLKDELKDFESRKTDRNNQFEEAKRQRFHFEGEIKVLQEKLKKYQEQLYAVTTNREYDAITLEIDAKKEKISEAEDEALTFLEKEETLTEEINELTPQVEELRNSLQEKEAALQEKIRATEDDYQQFEKKRSEVIDGIGKPILYQYERIRKGIGNSAVTELSKYSCSGCLSAIPAQKAVEIRSMSQLIFCESCGRILVSSQTKEVVVH